MSFKFKEGVVRVVRLVPKGKVVSYGQVALYVGVPRAARQVGWILRGLDKPPRTEVLGAPQAEKFVSRSKARNRETPVPWWRVVNNEGRISIKHSKFNALEQKALLTQEGVRVVSDLTFAIEKYRFMPDAGFVKKLELDPIYLGMISDKIPFTKPHFPKK